MELCNLNVMKEKEYGDLDLPPDFVRAELKYGEENEEDGVLQMALPLFDGEEDGYTAQCEQRQQCREPGMRDTCSSASDGTTESSEAKKPKEFYVVFNKVQEDGEKRADCSTSEVQHTPGFPESQASSLTIKAKSSSTCSVDSLTTNSKLGNETGPATGGKQDAEKRTVVLRQDGVRRAAEKLSGVMTPCSVLVSVEQDSGQLTDCDTKHDTTEMPADTTPPTFMADYVNLAGSGNGDPDGPPETFSGTIMINNQSIIVTIENGVLTLAAPPEGYTYKEDAVVSLKEHLGVKEHEDIVLLNYEGSTKSLGKMAEDEGGAVSDSEELTLTDDCSLSELGALDNCPSVKREEGTLCDSESTAAQTPRGPTEDDLQPASLVSPAGLAKKGVAVSYRCPQPGCACTFDSRQKLKMHLVFHAEDQRPFKCTVEGCGWSFTTSYKLKRHLQSHDKVRPYECEYENCGRRFTTIYNLKAHARAHEQEDAFACELCGERFRSATRLANHQRTHFEPERPHKCEFPGEKELVRVTFYILAIITTQLDKIVNLQNHLLFVTYT